MDTADAFAAIALGAVACDGVLDKDEAHALRSQLECRAPYNQKSESEMGELFDRLLSVLRQKQGLNNLVDEALPALTVRQQETALALAAQLVHADRVVAQEELNFLDTLCQRMAIPDGDAQGIVAAIMTLNRDILAG